LVSRKHTKTAWCETGGFVQNVSIIEELTVSCRKAVFEKIISVKPSEHSRGMVSLLYFVKINVMGTKILNK